jgi:hypothetical protein
MSGEINDYGVISTGGRNPVYVGWISQSFRSFEMTGVVPFRPEGRNPVYDEMDFSFVALTRNDGSSAISTGGEKSI